MQDSPTDIQWTEVHNLVVSSQMVEVGRLAYQLVGEAQKGWLHMLIAKVERRELLRIVLLQGGTISTFSPV